MQSMHVAASRRTVANHLSILRCPYANEEPRSAAHQLHLGHAGTVTSACCAPAPCAAGDPSRPPQQVICQSRYGQRAQGSPESAVLHCRCLLDHFENCVVLLLRVAGTVPSVSGVPTTVMPHVASKPVTPPGTPRDAKVIADVKPTRRGADGALTRPPEPSGLSSEASCRAVGDQRQVCSVACPRASGRLELVTQLHGTKRVHTSFHERHIRIHTIAYSACHECHHIVESDSVPFTCRRLEHFPRRLVVHCRCCTFSIGVPRSTRALKPCSRAPSSPERLQAVLPRLRFAAQPTPIFHPMHPAAVLHQPQTAALSHYRHQMHLM